jgi:hypothetical protein
MGRSVQDPSRGDPTDRHAAAVDALRQAAFQSTGSTQSAVRVAAGQGGELPEPLGSYAAKVRDQVVSHHRHRLRGAYCGRAERRYEAIVDALHVNLIFNIMSRLANAFDFSWDSEQHVRAGTQVIHRISYRLPRILMR